MKTVPLFILMLMAVTFRVNAEGQAAVIAEKDAKRFSIILPLNVTGFWIPSAGDVEKMNRAVVKYLEARLADRELSADEREKAKQVRAGFGSCWRQYVGIVVDGEKRIFCNAGGSGGSPEHFKTEPIVVLDGGAAFWRIQYIPAADRCVSFNANGEA